jgi:hypothetical protein
MLAAAQTHLHLLQQQQQQQQMWGGMAVVLIQHRSLLSMCSFVQSQVQLATVTSLLQIQLLLVDQHSGSSTVLQQQQQQQAVQWQQYCLSSTAVHQVNTTVTHLSC